MTSQTDRPAPIARRSHPGRAAVALVLGLAAGVPGGPSRAQDAAAGAGTPANNTFDGLLRTFDLKARPSVAPDFVTRTRPSSSTYVPVGRAHPDRPTKPMTPAEVEAATNALDAARVAQQRKAGLKPPPVPLKGAKDGPSTQR